MNHTFINLFFFFFLKLSFFLVFRLLLIRLLNFFLRDSFFGFLKCSRFLYHRRRFTGFELAFEGDLWSRGG